MDAFEKLGVFYLGTVADGTAEPAQPLLYESKDLTTHAVCVGMTGSGKTGLCIGLLEEAAIDGIPAIAVDPKGDIANLLLTFPELRPADFRPWINEHEAETKGVTADDFAAQKAELWKKGLLASGQDGARIQRLREAAETSIYTPGSDAGLPVSVLRSFSAPSAEAMEDAELMRDRVSATATSLLGLIGEDADPINSREHVLLANILDQSWRQGCDLDLPSLIAQIQNPPFQKAGVLDVETFFPSKQRFALAMKFNNLLASPGFQSWLEGEPLDIERLLHTEAGKPRISIFSIAHLSETERMFFVSLLLNQLLSWVRTQSGTTSLRALFYMDEIFGYFPPIADPPSKKPLLSLLKQARAYGLGLVLATQNPVDLDYKGLANTGTWFIGRLQTERDKMRVLDGLEGAAGQASTGFNRAAIDQLLSGLRSRQFLLNNVHEDRPQLFQTRWTMSYLSGPLTREQIRLLMKDRKPDKLTHPPQPAGSEPPNRGPHSAASVPLLPPEITSYFVPALHGDASTYKPVLLGAATLHYLDIKTKIDEVRRVLFATTFEDGPGVIDWDRSRPLIVSLDELEREPDAAITFVDLPKAAANPKNYPIWTKRFAAWIFRAQQLNLLKSPSLGVISTPGETEGAFRVRLQQMAREERDRLAESLKQKYASKFAALEEKKRRAELNAQRQKSQQNQAILDTALSAGSSLLGAFLGRKAISVTNASRAATVARQAGKSWRESQDVAQATETVEQVVRQQTDLQAQFEADLAAQQARVDPATEQFEPVTVRLKKSNITVDLVALGWNPNV